MSGPHRTAEIKVKELWEYVHTLEDTSSAAKEPLVQRFRDACRVIQRSFDDEKRRWERDRLNQYLTIGTLSFVGLVVVAAMVAAVTLHQQEGRWSFAYWAVIVVQIAVCTILLLVFSFDRSAKYAHNMAKPADKGGLLEADRKAIQDYLLLDPAIMAALLGTSPPKDVYDRHRQALTSAVANLKRQSESDLRTHFAKYDASRCAAHVRDIIDRHRRLLRDASRSQRVGDSGDIFNEAVLPKLARFVVKHREDVEERERGNRSEDVDAENVESEAATAWNDADKTSRLAWKRLWSSLDLIMLYSLQITARRSSDAADFPYPSVARFMPHVLKAEDVPALYDELPAAHWDALRAVFQSAQSNHASTWIADKTTSDSAILESMTQTFVSFYEGTFASSVPHLSSSLLRFSMTCPRRVKILLTQRFTLDGTGSPFGLSQTPASQREVIVDVIVKTIVSHMSAKIDQMAVRSASLSEELAAELIEDARSTRTDHPVKLVEVQDALMRKADPNRTATSALSKALKDADRIVASKFQKSSSAAADAKTDKRGFKTLVDAMTLEDLERALDATTGFQLMDAFNARFAGVGRFDSSDLLFDAFGRKEFVKFFAFSFIGTSLLLYGRFSASVLSSIKGTSSAWWKEQGVLLVLTTLAVLFFVSLMVGAVLKRDKDFEIEKASIDAKTGELRDAFKQLNDLLGEWKASKVGNAPSTMTTEISKLGNISDANKDQLLAAIEKTVAGYDSCTYLTHPSVDTVVPFPQLDVSIYALFAIVALILSGLAFKKYDPVGTYAEIRSLIMDGKRSLPNGTSGSAQDAAFWSIVVFVAVFLLKSTYDIIRYIVEYSAGSVPTAAAERSCRR